MNRLIAFLARFLGKVVLPSLEAVQVSQAQQIAANNRLESSIDQLRVHILHMESQFALISTQLTACRAELAATQAVIKAVNTEYDPLLPDSTTLVN
jgi:hypothetical protein